MDFELFEKIYQAVMKYVYDILAYFKIDYIKNPYAPEAAE